MADGAQSGGGGRWAAEAGPDFRRRVVDKIVGKLAEVYVGKLAPCLELYGVAAKYEATVFGKANSVHDYITRISRKMFHLEQQRQQMLQAASGLQQQMQMGCQMQPAHAVQAIQRGDSSVAAMPQAASAVALPRRPPSQLQNMQIKVKQEQPDMMATLDQMLNSQPSAVTSMAPVIQLQSGQRTVQTQSKTEWSARQLQPRNYAGCNPASVPQLLGQPVVRSNAQENQLLRQNASDIGTQQRQPQLMRMNQQDLMANQQQMDSQRYQMQGAQQVNVAAMQIGHPGGRNNQHNAGRTAALQPSKACEQMAAIREPIRMESRPMTPPQRQITVGQQSSLPCQSPQTSATMGSAAEVDWKEEMFQKITSLKNAYFSELSELDRTVAFQQITKEQFRSLPKEQSDQYMFTGKVTAGTRSALNFLQLQKSNMPEGLKEQFPKYEISIHHLVGFHRKIKARIVMNTRRQSKNCHEPPRIVNPTGDTAPFTGGTRIKQKTQEQPADESISKLMQDIGVRTPPARQENHSDHLVGQEEDDISKKKQKEQPAYGSISELPRNIAARTPPALQQNRRDRLVGQAEDDISKQKQQEQPADESISKLTQDIAVRTPPARQENHTDHFLGQAEDDISKQKQQEQPADGSISELPRNIAARTPPALQQNRRDRLVDQAEDDISKQKQQEQPADGSISELPRNIAARTSPGLKQNRSDHLVGHAEDEVRGEAETPVAKKPIDRLVDAVRSSSPAALRDFANSVRLKRSFDHVTSLCGSPPSGSMDGSCVSFECGTASESESSGESSCKRQQIQNGNGALLGEIKAANGTLIDAVISIAGDKGEDGTMITFCYSAVSLAPSLKSVLTESETSLDMAAKLLVPADYPRSSPVLLGDEGDEQTRKKLSGISGAVDVAFRRALGDLPEPRSIKETASAWELCMRRAVVEFAHRHGGGTFSSRYGRWESCVGA